MQLLFSFSLLPLPYYPSQNWLFCSDVCWHCLQVPCAISWVRVCALFLFGMKYYICMMPWWECAINSQINPKPRYYLCCRDTANKLGKVCLDTWAYEMNDIKYMESMIARQGQIWISQPQFGLIFITLTILPLLFLLLFECLQPTYFWDPVRCMHPPINVHWPSPLSSSHPHPPLFSNPFLSLLLIHFSSWVVLFLSSPLNDRYPWRRDGFPNGHPHM